MPGFCRCADKVMAKAFARCFFQCTPARENYTGIFKIICKSKKQKFGLTTVCEDPEGE